MGSLSSGVTAASLLAMGCPMGLAWRFPHRGIHSLSSPTVWRGRIPWHHQWNRVVTPCPRRGNLTLRILLLFARSQTQTTHGDSSIRHRDPGSSGTCGYFGILLFTFNYGYLLHPSHSKGLGEHRELGAFGPIRSSPGSGATRCSHCSGGDAAPSPSISLPPSAPA